MSRMTKLAIALGLAGAAAALAAALATVPLVATVELKTYDLRMRSTVDVVAPREGDLSLVEIDEMSLRRMEPLVGRWPWPRLVHAHVVNFLARASVRAILYDVLFTEHDRHSFDVGSERWTGGESDRVFAGAIARAGNVVLMADAVAEAMEGAPADAPDLPDVAALHDYRLGVRPEARPVVVLPYDELARSARAIGHNLVVYDADGPLRRVVPFVAAGNRALPSGPLATVLIASGIAPSQVDLERGALTVGGRRAPILEVALVDADGSRRTGYRMLLDYQGTYPRVSFYDLFYAEQQMLAGVKPDVDPARFRDRIVIVGTTAPGLQDVFTVPLRGKMSGSEIHANVIDSLMHGRFMAPARGGLAAAALIACALAVALAAVWFDPWIALAVAAATSGALYLASLAWFRRGVWLPVTSPSIAIALATFGGTAYHYFVEGREKRKVKQLFSRFVSRDVYHRLLEDPRRAALGGERRDMTVLFCDIRGFTTLSEVSPPEAIVATLNEYFTRMVSIVLAQGGTVDKFVGDLIMALFGAPLDDADHADHAVQTALAMSRELDALNGTRRANGQMPFDIGVGINSGEMVAGMIGSDRILSYTVIGDAVNLGSRLEGLNKQYGTRIIVSDATRTRLKARYEIRPLGDVTVKGRSQPISIFEVQARL
jgi:adenylate cyclase